LAGIADPDSSDDAGGDGEMREDQKRMATELCLMLATHFNRKTLDAMTLWTRIGTALAVSSVKVQDGDLSRFITLCLETVKAHSGVFAADETALKLVETFVGKSVEWRQSFVRYIAARSYIIIILGRGAWEDVKAERSAMWEQRRWKRAEQAIGANRHLSGVRADESGVRKIRMRRWGLSTDRTCCPLGWWSKQDAFGYAAAKNLPVHPNYAMLGGGRWPRENLRVDGLGGVRGRGIGRAEWEREYYSDSAPGIFLEPVPVPYVAS
jgi:hypothetical protein